MEKPNLNFMSDLMGYIDCYKNEMDKETTDNIYGLRSEGENDI